MSAGGGDGGDGGDGEGLKKGSKIVKFARLIHFKGDKGIYLVHL
jgi:hypothetical protein